MADPVLTDRTAERFSQSQDNIIWKGPPLPAYNVVGTQFGPLPPLSGPGTADPFAGGPAADQYSVPIMTDEKISLIN